MQQKLTLFPAIALFTLLQLFAIHNLQAQGDPGTNDDGFIVQITSPASIAQELKNGNDGLTCGWVGSTYGPSLTEDLCGQVVWADDSLACTAVADLTGKIALIRRGSCGFSLKVYHAQQAGAIAVIVVNHYANDAIGDNSCAAYIATANGNLLFGGMSGLDSAAAVTIPSVFLQRETGEQITGALDAGQTVEVCFSLPRLYNPVAAYHYATPVTQVDTLNNIGVRFVNRNLNAPQTNVILKADVKEPNGNVTTLTTTVNNVGIGVDTFVYFPAYLPPAILGRFDVTYSSNIYDETRDSLKRSFYHTPYTFASDNLTIAPGGVATTAENFALANFQQQSGSLYLSGPNGGVAAYATFGIANASAIAGTGADDVTIILYDGDPDSDNVIDFVGGFTDLDNLPGGQVGFGTYTMTGAEPADSLLTIDISDFTTGGPVTLKPRHPYYLSILYNGSNGTTGTDIALSRSTDELYLNFPTTPLFLDQLYSGYSNSTIIQRLQLEGYPKNLVSTKPQLLEASKVVVTPIPANDQIRLDIKLAKVNDAVTVSLIDWTGRFVSTQLLKNFQNGQTSFNVAALPAGNYLVQVSANEGTTMRKVTVAH